MTELRDIVAEGKTPAERLLAKYGTDFAKLYEGESF